MERRELIQWLVATAGLQSLKALDPADLLALGRDVHRGAPVRRTLSAVDVAAERILPGAAAANVGAFIDKMLTDWHTPEERERFLAGLKELDARGNFVDRSEADHSRGSSTSRCTAIARPRWACGRSSCTRCRGGTTGAHPYDRF